MKQILSLAACLLIGIVLMQYRISSPGFAAGRSFKITEWDAFGYYVYLPSICIYKDYKELNWLPEIDSQYHVTGGNGWQAERLGNGNHVFKYLGGIAIMQAPFFVAGHIIATRLHYPPDGFSPPYQYALTFGAIFYCLLAVFLLRKILLMFFSDLTTAITLVMVCLATNFIQYAAVDNGLSHCYIFLLYALVLYTTIKWHKCPKLIWALLTGYVIGLATISRPTEAIMLFIPLLWQLQNKETASQKWKQVKDHRSHVIGAILGGVLGILPQLIYWKSAAGSFIYDVGSKWEFLNPHFRVLFGWEKGWFIYTPVTLLFIAGLFFMKSYPFRKAAIWFGLLNIYIIISWYDWRYGGSYSTRALVQSYPVFALPFAAFTERISLTKWRFAFYILYGYLLFVNLFQVKQYNRGVIHYNDMNRLYYSSIYLNPSPSPFDMSLLDNNELLNDEKNYSATLLVNDTTSKTVRFPATETKVFLEIPLSGAGSGNNDRWLKIEAAIKAPGHLWESFLYAELKIANSVKQVKIRLNNPLAEDLKINSYGLYLKIPPGFGNGRLRLYLGAARDFEGFVQKVRITELEK